MARLSKDLADHSLRSNGDAEAMQSLRQTKNKLPRIAVVGAGVSGLRCADILLRGDADVTLFEARNLVGGRLHQIERDGRLFDMGPNWIHGTIGNPMMAFAEKTRTEILDPPESGAAFDEYGNRFSDEEAAELASSMWETVFQAFKYSDANLETIDSQMSLYDYFKQELPKRLKDKRQIENVLHEAQSWGPFVGDPIDRQSLKYFFLEDWVEGGNVFVASTYNKILKEISTPVIERDIIQFNTEVVRYQYGEHDVTLRTADGTEQRFDEVVITCPLGWLKHNKENAFSPALPRRLSQAIESISYGRLEKLYVTFPAAFWLDLSSESPTTTFPLFTHYHNPTYVAHPKNEPWNQNVMSLAHLPGQTSHPTLLFYIYGPCATHITKLIASDEPHSRAYNDKLDAFAKPFYSLLPNFSAEDSHCRPVSYLMTQWQNDRFAGNGSYSNFQVGLEHGDEDIVVMRDAGGLTEQGIWLAGEDTAPFAALGTTTGAYWSGEAVARQICGRYGLQLEPELEREIQVSQKQATINDPINVDVPADT